MTGAVAPGSLKLTPVSKCESIPATITHRPIPTVMTTASSRLVSGVLLTLVSILYCASGFTEESTDQIDAFNDTAESLDSLINSGGEGRQDAKRNFVAMPMPVSNPTIGTGLAGVVMWIHQFDKLSPPSSATVGAFYTNTESKGIFAGEEAYFGENRYRLNLVTGVFDMNLKFFGIGNDAGDNGRSIKVNQSGGAVRPQFLWRIRDSMYLGPTFSYLTVETQFADLPNIPLPPDFPLQPEDLSIKLTSSGPGARFEYDTRENRLNPQSGSHLDLIGTWFDDSFGSDLDFTKVQLSYSHYFPMRQNDILAVQGTVCGNGGRPPFYGLCQLGSAKDLRGYVGGQYRDERRVSAQVEYRWSLPKRFGIVIFGGVGQVGSNFGDFTLDNFLPSIGAGARWMASVEHKVNVSIDYARGKDSDAWYFYIGEAF